MSLTVNPGERAWEDQIRYCVSPEGRLLTWHSSDGVKRRMYRFRNQRIPDADGEALRAAWNGPLD